MSLLPAQAQFSRVVSANLCADQLLLALADPAQITSLGRFSRDRAISYFWREAAAFPVNRGSAEELMSLKSSLVLLGSFDNRYTRAVLQRRGVEFALLEPWTSLKQGRTQISDMANRLGQTARGEALIRRIDAGIEGLRLASAEKARGRSVLILHRRGHVAQTGVLAELAELAGFRNAAGPGAFVQLEKIVASPPDFLITSGRVERAGDQGEAFLAHPALARLFPPAKRIFVPDRLTICAGPSTPDLIEAFAAELLAKVF